MLRLFSPAHVQGDRLCEAPEQKLVQGVLGQRQLDFGQRQLHGRGGEGGGRHMQRRMRLYIGSESNHAYARNRDTGIQCAGAQEDMVVGMHRGFPPHLCRAIPRC